MTDETKKRLEEIGERESKAIKGEWVFEDWEIKSTSPESPYMKDNGKRIPIDITADGYPEDFEFIANARQDIPFLLGLVKEQQAEIENLGGCNRGNRMGDDL